MTAFSTNIYFVPRNSEVNSGTFEGVDYRLVSLGIKKDVIERLNAKFDFNNRYRRTQKREWNFW